MMTPAVVSWAAHLGWLQLGDSALAFLASPISVGIFSLLAIGELIGDKLPFIPSRTEIGPILVRLISGGLGGASLAISANQSLVAGVVPGATGAVVGAFVGYETRKRLVASTGLKDFYVALPEDLLAIGLALLIVWP